MKDVYACNLIINEHTVKRKLSERQVDNQANKNVDRWLRFYNCLCVFQSTLKTKQVCMTMCNMSGRLRSLFYNL